MNDRESIGRTTLADVYQLDNVDELLLMQIAEYPDSTLRDLADLVGYSKAGVSKRLKKPAFRRALRDLQSTAEDKLMKAVHKAIQKLNALLDSDSEKVQLESAKILLSHYFDRHADLSSPKSVIYKVRFGPQGQLYRESVEGDTDSNNYPTTLVAA